MPRRNFRLLLAVVLAIGFGCVPPPGSMAPPSLSSAVSLPVKGALTCNLNIQVLRSGYYPDPTSNSYSLPTSNIQAGYQMRAEISQDISDAITNAPPSLLNDLCGLSGVFIDTTACGGDLNNCQNLGHTVPVSWGYRSSNPNHGDQGNMYLAIPGWLWAGGGHTHAMTLSTYEKQILGYFVQNAGSPAWPNPPTISSANPDQPWGSVLAALAHELGHVKFNYTIHPNATYGRNYNFSALQPCSIGGGSTIPDFFSGWSYGNNPKKLVPKEVWREFGFQDDDNGDTMIDHSAHPTLSDFTTSGNPNPLLYTLYAGNSQPWASFWGAWSPDEDFVETYVLYALTANVSSLQISIPGNNPYDIIPGIRSKIGLTNKINCIANLPAL